MNACSACAQREAITSVRDHGMGGVDITLGLKDLGDGIFACPECGQRYERTENLAEPPYMFQDYDMYYFRKLEPVLPRAKPPVQPPQVAPPPPPSPPPQAPAEDEDSSLRCPKCRSSKVELELWYDLTKFTCQACNHFAFLDWTDRDEWDSEVQDREDARKEALAKAPPESPPPEPPPVSPPATPPAPPPVFAEVASLTSSGCASCGGVQAKKAWASLHGQHVASLVREVHFGIDVKRCACGQPWVVVFTERVDHLDGNDDQTWLAVPVTDAEVSVLTTCDRSHVPRGVAELGRGRRFLLRSNALPEIAWRDRGFAILPHG